MHYNNAEGQKTIGGDHFILMPFSEVTTEDGGHAAFSALCLYSIPPCVHVSVPYFLFCINAVTFSMFL